jgi:hypothetical protein
MICMFKDLCLLKLLLDTLQVLAHHAGALLVLIQLRVNLKRDVLKLLDLQVVRSSSMKLLPLKCETRAHNATTYHQAR